MKATGPGRPHPPRRRRTPPAAPGRHREVRLP